MNIVVDTNVFISAIFWDKIPLDAIRVIFKNDYKIFVNEKILLEYFRIIKKLSSKNYRLHKKWNSILFNSLEIIDTPINFDICRDVNDNMFLDCSFACSANYLISGDDDLLSLEKFFDTKIIKPNNFMKI